MSTKKIQAIAGSRKHNAQKIDGSKISGADNSSEINVRPTLNVELKRFRHNLELLRYNIHGLKNCNAIISGNGALDRKGENSNDDKSEFLSVLRQFTILNTELEVLIYELDIQTTELSCTIGEAST